MGGGGSNSGGGGNGGSANDGNAGEAEARAYIAAKDDSARQPIKETAATESAPAPVAAAPDAPAAPSESEKTAADNVARERATAAAAKAESERAAAAQQAAAASLMGGAGENQNANPFSATVASDKQLADRAQLAKVNDLRQQANEKLSSYYGKDANKYATTADKDPNAVVNVYKNLMGPLTKQTMTLGGGDKAREVSVDVPQNTFVDAFGRSPTYAESKALQAAGLGNITGVNAKNLTNMNASVEGVEGLTYNDPGQTADSIVATTDFVNFIEPLARAAALFVPGMSLALTLNDMRTGKITAGDVASSFVLSMIARNFGIPVGVVTNAINGNPGGMISSALVGQINTAVSKEFNTNPILTGIFGRESGVYGEVAKPFNGLNQNWGTTKAISNAFNEGLRSVGITAGTGAPNSATGQQVNTSTDSNDTLSNYLNSTGGGGSSAAPAPAAPAPSAPAPAKAAPATSGNTSKSSSSLDALGAAAFGLTGALGSSLGSSDATDSSAANTASLSSVAPLSMASNIQTKVIPNQPKFRSALEEFQQLQQSENPDAVQYALSDQTPQGDSMAPYSYGVDRPIEDILNSQDVAMQDSGYGYSPDGIPDYMKTGIQAASGGAMTGTRYGKYARGGLSTPLMAAGGKMRVDFRSGDAVTGAGDGQSDDIPAMLADGEFVFPADVVAAIGNGSTKAGSDKLYDMMHGIRAHVRSAKPRDLPPEIKSPLDFLKNTKRTRQGAKHG
jgi:hypothetical protein